MKTIKTILTILIIVTLLFFGTGMVVKENNYTSEVIVNKSLSETFRLFNNRDRIMLWCPEIKKIETIEEKPDFTGSKYRITMDNNGEMMTSKEKILAYVKDQKVTLFFDAEQVLKTYNYTFTRQGNSTKILLEASVQTETYMLSCVFPYIKGKFRKVDEQYLSNFKAFAEKQ